MAVARSACAARVVGDIRYETLAIEAEAQIDGHIQRTGEGFDEDREATLALVHDSNKG